MSSPLEKALSSDEDEGNDSITKILREFTTTTNIETKTELSTTEIIAIAKVKLFGQRYCTSDDKGKTFCDYLVDTVMILKVSKDRKGRGELGNALARGIQWETEKN